MIPPVFSPFYNNPCLKDVQAFYAKELPISPPDPITSPAILTPSPILPPSLLFDPRYFFVPEELLPSKKRIHSPSSSSTMLSNSSRNQTCNLISPSFLVYTPTPPQVFEIGKCSDKMYLKHHEKQVEDILNYLDKLSLHRIEKMEEGRTNDNELKTELKRIRTQIIKLQRKKMPPKRTSTSETPAITLAAIQQLINDGISSALKAQAASMANTDNTNKNTGTSGTLVARKGINDHKRKFEDRGNTTNNNNYPKHNNNNHSNNRNNNNYQDNNNKNNHNNDYHQQQHKRQEAFKTYAATNGYTGNLPLCKRCRLHHTGPCSVKCQNIMQISAQKQIIGPQESILRADLAFVHFRISTLETTLEDIQVHQNLLQSENFNHQATILVVWMGIPGGAVSYGLGQGQYERPVIGQLYKAGRELLDVACVLSVATSNSVPVEIVDKVVSLHSKIFNDLPIRECDASDEHGSGRVMVEGVNRGSSGQGLEWLYVSVESGLGKSGFRCYIVKNGGGLQNDAALKTHKDIRRSFQIFHDDKNPQPHYWERNPYQLREEAGMVPLNQGIDSVQKQSVSIQGKMIVPFLTRAGNGAHTVGGGWRMRTKSMTHDLKMTHFCRTDDRQLGKINLVILEDTEIRSGTSGRLSHQSEKRVAKNKPRHARLPTKKRREDAYESADHQQLSGFKSSNILRTHGKHVRLGDLMTYSANRTAHQAIQ
ncbi:hypothetical protein Tco_0407268 [Tanacetum coccineum]